MFFLFWSRLKRITVLPGSGSPVTSAHLVLIQNCGVLLQKKHKRKKQFQSISPWRRENPTCSFPPLCSPPDINHYENVFYLHNACWHIAMQRAVCCVWEPQASQYGQHIWSQLVPTGPNLCQLVPTGPHQLETGGRWRCWELQTPSTGTTTTECVCVCVCNWINLLTLENIHA